MLYRDMVALALSLIVGAVQCGAQKRMVIKRLFINVTQNGPATPVVRLENLHEI